MQRNLDRRVEVAVPVKNEKIRRYIKQTVRNAYLRDTTSSRTLKADGTYEKVSGEGSESFDSQMFFVGQDPRI